MVRRSEMRKMNDEYDTLERKYSSLLDDDNKTKLFS